MKINRRIQEVQTKMVLDLLFPPQKANILQNLSLCELPLIKKYRKARPIQILIQSMIYYTISIDHYQRFCVLR